jgi:hypothetical protein
MFQTEELSKENMLEFGVPLYMYQDAEIDFRTEAYLKWKEAKKEKFAQALRQHEAEKSIGHTLASSKALNRLTRIFRTSGRKSDDGPRTPKKVFPELFLNNNHGSGSIGGSGVSNQSQDRELELGAATDLKSVHRSRRSSSGEVDDIKKQQEGQAFPHHSRLSRSKSHSDSDLGASMRQNPNKKLSPIKASSSKPGSRASNNNYIHQGGESDKPNKRRTSADLTASFPFAGPDVVLIKSSSADFDEEERLALEQAMHGLDAEMKTDNE